ncbi:MAG: DUF4843 domain-containing protein [Odoribacteraceae bacterium]|jgi:hypothetical protein|nr:DUF4843 domain-containing protein [Odoribacteraceae bacterium]
MKTDVMTWTFALVLPLLSCEEKVVHRYESENSLYFFKGAEQYNTFVQSDSLTYNFMAKQGDRQRDTIRLRVLAAGFLSDRDREVYLVQINGDNPLAAVGGTHYVPFDDPGVAGSMVIPAGSTRADLPVIVSRDPSLRSQEVRLEVELRENAHFKVVIPELSRFVIKIVDMIAKPANWDFLWQSYLGNWGPEKMRFLADYVGIADFEGTHEATEMLFYRSKAIEKLNEYNSTREEPLTEADGTLVTFPT